MAGMFGDQIVIAGGMDNGGDVTNSTELWSESTGRFVIGPPMKTPRVDAAGLTIGVSIPSDLETDTLLVCYHRIICDK